MIFLATLKGGESKRERSGGRRERERERSYVPTLYSSIRVIGTKLNNILLWRNDVTPNIWSTIVSVETFHHICVRISVASHDNTRKLNT